MAINCPKCESDNVQSLSMIHADGTSEINTRTVGGGGTRGGFGGGVAHTRGTQQSALAKKANPPAKKRPILIILGMSLLGFMLGLILEFPVGQFATFLAWGGFTFWGVKMAISANNWNKNEWPQLHEAWDHSWMCMKCGNFFELLMVVKIRANLAARFCLARKMLGRSGEGKPWSRVKGRLRPFAAWRSAPLTRRKGDTLRHGSKCGSFALAAMLNHRVSPPDLRGFTPPAT